MKTFLISIFVALLLPAATLAKQYPSGSPLGTVSGLVELQAGGVYRGDIRVAGNGTTIRPYGVGPSPIVRGGLNSDNRNDLTIQGITFEGTGLKRTGVRIINVTRFRFLDNTVTNFSGSGLTVEGYQGKSQDVVVEGNVFYKNRPSGSGAHCQGAFFAKTFGLVFRYNVVDTNGWDGVSGATQFNHGVYHHGSAGPAIIEWNVFANNSSYGLQQRAGGDSRHNIFLQNELHHSYGYVKGEAVFPNGVSGEITDNWYIGNRAARAGWAGDLSNAADVNMHDCYLYGTQYSTAKAFNIKNCEQIENPGQYLKPASWKLRVDRLTRWNGWGPGAVDKRTGGEGVVVSNIDLLPPISANLETALGVSYLLEARQNPRKAAQLGIERMKLKCGYTLIPENPPPVTQPTPPIVLPPGETLETVIRTRPADIKPGVENNEAVLRILTDGPDPIYGVKGDEVKRK